MQGQRSSTQRVEVEDFKQVSQEFSLISLDDVERQATILQQSSQQGKSSDSVLDLSLKELIDQSIQTISESIQHLNQLCFYIKYSQKWETQQGYCNVYKKTMYIRLQQLFMLISISLRSDDEEFLGQLGLIYSGIKGFQIPYSKQSKFNIQMIRDLLKTEKPYLKSFNDLASEIVNRYSKNLFNQVNQGLLDLKVIHSKIYTIAEIFPSACLFPLDDILNPSQRGTQRWETLCEHITYRCYGSAQSTHKSFRTLKEQVIWASAAMSTLNEIDKSKLKKPQQIVEYIKKGFGLFGLLFLKKDAQRQAEKFMSQPDTLMTKKIFNMTDQGITKRLLSMIIPNIDYSEKVYIPRNMGFVRLDSLGDILTKRTDIGQTIKQKYHIEHLSAYRNSLTTRNPLRIQLRINCSTPLEYKVKQAPTIIQRINGLFKQSPRMFNSVVLHIHGGGFISMSSYSHQIYTRKWANQIGVPIISVDYAKAPEFPYPFGLDDCFQAYLWILNTMPQVYQIQPLKIYLVGDSAGGNLVTALTGLLIKLGLKVPDGIFLIYPALNISSKTYTPSLIHSLQDFILPHTYLKICAKQYLQDYVNEKDYLLSPIIIPEEILKAFPVTRIFVGSEDPFHDDCIRLTEKLLQVKVDTELTVYQNFGHGFLQFDNVIQPIYQARKAVEEIGAKIKEMIGK